MSHICLFEQRPRLCSDYQQKSNLLNIQILSGWVFECLDGTKLKTKTWNLFIFKIPIRFLLKHLILDVLVVRIRFKIFLSLNNKVKTGDGNARIIHIFILMYQSPGYPVIRQGAYLEKRWCTFIFPTSILKASSHVGNAYVVTKSTHADTVGCFWTHNSFDHSLAINTVDSLPEQIWFEKQSDFPAVST